MLNFSIAYGKTAMGIAQDWKVYLEYLDYWCYALLLLL